ncbi:MAG: alanine--tRNA ligase [Persicimonas sp.]
MNPHDIRDSYLKYFEERDHRVVDSAPVVPEGDPTLLFTNAGMNQFKDVLLGNENRDYQRATSVQKCIRAGGKHNDLDEVGKDGRHLTFFEMLGNWSFGDYYKGKAIEWAWDYVLNVLELEEDRLYVTTYKDDDESYDIWTDQIGLADERVLKLGDIEEGNEENFWSMGPTGPCGPCTEIHYDHHPEDGELTFEVGYDEERIVEIWNLVFMEFNRDETGALNPLPMKSVDTGMGLDRVAMIKAGRDNVFQTELFTPIFEATLELVGDKVADWDTFYARDDFTNFAVIADHVRTVTFAVCDGAKFANEGRGYVLRRILRRAVRYGRELGLTEPFLHKVSQAVVDNYSDIYPELEATGQEAAELMRLEEERFFRNIDRGIELFEQAAENAQAEGRDELSGQEVFQLHATYGFPPDLTELMAEEKSLSIDWQSYERLWAEHQEASRGKDVHADAAGVGDWITVYEEEDSEFVGYDKLEAAASITRFRPVGEDRFQVLLTRTPFYAESGGQIGDRGSIRAADDSVVFRVVDTQRSPIGIVHVAEREKGTIARESLKGEFVASVDPSLRRQTMANHTATHLLHAALRNIVSDSIFQSGSLVAPDRLRFDFSHGEPLTDEQVRAVEERVNQIIREGREVKPHVDVSRERAVDQMGAMAIFGEKYGDTVRVVEIPGESVELCGGTHVKNTGDINLFRITSESGVAAGIRRIEAVTEQTAYESFREDADTLSEVAKTLKTDTYDLLKRAYSLLDEKADLERQVDRLSQKLAQTESSDLISGAVDVDGVKVIASKIGVETRDQMLQYADKLREQLDEGVVLLASELDGKAALVCVVTEPAFKKRGLKAGDLVNAAAEHVDGRGGGRPTLAQAGGSKPDGLSAAVDHFADAVRAAL